MCCEEGSNAIHMRQQKLETGKCSIAHFSDIASFSVRRSLDMKCMYTPCIGICHILFNLLLLEALDLTENLLFQIKISDSNI